MKKFTLATLIIFAFVLVGVLILSIMYPTVDVTKTPSGTTSVTDSAAPLTLEEVAKHNKQGDCYLVINNKVYDVSTYIGKHPGGSQTIVSRCGEVVTGIFASIHSNFAWDLLNDYYIGLLVSGDSSSIASISDQLNKIKSILSKKYPNSEIVNVKPKNDFYVAELIYNKSLYEIHVDASGNVLSEEVGNDEFDWSSWDSDTDDM